MRYLDLTLRAALALLPFALTLASAGWFLLQSPFATPVIARSTDQIEAALTRAMAREVTLAWILPRLQEAVLLEDLDRLDLLLGLANDHGILLPRPMVEDIAALNARVSGWLARTTACGACAIDITACETVAQIGVCAVPFELTPAGDLNAIRRAGQDYLSGVAVDRLDLGLAIVGLGATGAVLATGGTSYSVKAGTSLLRAARSLGTLTPAFATQLRALVGDAVRWDRVGDLVRGRLGPQAVVNSAQVAELADLGADLQRIAQHTSLAETVTLLRHVDSAEDAARLARVTESMGPRSRGAFEVLGPSRVLRATTRISSLAIGAALSMYLVALQVLVFITQQGALAGLRWGARRLV